MASAILPLVAVENGVPHIALGPNGDDIRLLSARATPKPVTHTTDLSTLFPNSLSSIHVIVGPYFHSVDRALVHTLFNYVHASHNRTLTSIDLTIDNSIWTDGIQRELLSLIQRYFLSRQYRLKIKDRLLEYTITSIVGGQHTSYGLRLSLALASDEDILNSLHRLEPINQLVIVNPVPLSNAHLPLIGLASRPHTLANLREVTVPVIALSTHFLRALGRTRLAVLEVTSAAFPAGVPQLSSATAGLFSSLRTLKASCTLSEFSLVIPAVCTESSSLQSLAVRTKRLTSSSEMRSFNWILTQRTPLLCDLFMHFSEVDAMESAAWMDVVSLSNLCELRRISISHPRPLPLSSRDLQHMLRAWTRATDISLNPYSRDPAWPRAETPGLSSLNFQHNPVLIEFSARLSVRTGSSPLPLAASPHHSLVKLVLPGISPAFRNTIISAFPGIEITF